MRNLTEWFTYRCESVIIARYEVGYKLSANISSFSLCFVPKIAPVDSMFQAISVTVSFPFPLSPPSPPSLRGNYHDQQ